MQVASRQRAQSYFGIDRQSMNQTDDSGAETESRARRKFQRANNTDDNDIAHSFRKPSIPASASATASASASVLPAPTASPVRHVSVGSDPKQLLMAHRRRPTPKENRAPLGPRPYNDSPSKRIASEGVVPASFANNRSFLPNSTSEPFFEKPYAHNLKNEPRFNFGDSSSSSNHTGATHTGHASQSSFDFLPPVNFDDFQTSLASYDSTSGPRLSEFASGDPGPNAPSLFSKELASRNANASTMGRNRNAHAQAQAHVRGQGHDLTADTDIPPVPSLHVRDPRIQQSGRMASGNPAQRHMSQPNLDPSHSAPQNQSSSLVHRSRRQSVAPMAATNGSTIRHVPGAGSGSSSGSGSGPSTTALAAVAPLAAPAVPLSTPVKRAPRKSIGPGSISSLMPSRQQQQEQKSAALASGQPVTSVPRTPSLNNARRNTINPYQGPLEPLKSHAMQPTRASQAKSVQQQHQQQLPRAGTMPDLAFPVYQNPTPAKPIGSRNKRSDTPSSIDKRKSGRMSGLGARTISPTDARRLRRMSVKQPQPPSPHKEPPKEFKPPRSPSLIPRLPSGTPIPSGATPEPNRVTVPQVSLSRSSSYQSLRPPSASASKIPQSASTSRLPGAKPRNVYSSADGRDDEIVPPVPAIPKAYESPKDQIEIPFFHGAVPASSHESEAPLPTSSSMHNGLGQTTERSRRRGMTNADAAPAETPPQAPATVNKKALQATRLPPFSLNPISTPTSARIASYHSEPSNPEANEVQPTTPPRRSNAKTPSTPMTASKATFYRHTDDDEDERPLPIESRSNTSHHLLRGGPGFGEPGAGVPLPPAYMAKRAAITPYSSGSLPKPATNPRSRLPDEYTLGHGGEVQSAGKPLGPRPRTASKSVAQDSASQHTLSSTEDQDPPSTGNSLRRKLSLGWRKNSSKSNASSTDVSREPSAKHDEMPPPKFPASANWNRAPEDAAVSQPGSAGGRPSMEAGSRKASVASTSSATTNGTPVKAVASAVPTSSRVQTLAMQQPQPAQRSSSWSILGSSNRIPTPKPAPPMPVKPKYSPVTDLDRDDILANEEMRRLSTKRREVDVAARETEELRKRATKKERLSPAKAIQASAGLLNIFEKGEIIDYTDGVYFCGRKDAKKHVGDFAASGALNYGYDDERGDYLICIGDHLAYRYEVIDILGKGSFGQVVRCIDHKHGCLVAVKIIRNKKRFHQQALVEVNILQKLREWDPDGSNATLTITSSFYFRSHLCITSPCLSINLYELIRSHGFAGFSLNLIRRFSRQLLACLCLLQSKRIIHCDLKPENILLCDPRRADVRVIDFGSSCKADEKVYTYIQSRFYRSPEVILGSEYGLGIDMWSIGCILAELYTGYPLFPGENEQEQLACIMEIFGPPSRDIVEKCTRRKLFFDSALKPRITVSSKGRRRRPSSKTLSAAIKCDDEAFLDFLAQCFRWDPEKRMRPDQAVDHPFIRNEPMRRAERPRVRTANGPMSASGLATSSPIKRVHTTSGAIASSTSSLASGSSSSLTPKAAEVRRPLPDTPGTAMKNGIPISTSSPMKSSAVAASASKRQNTVGNGTRSNTQGVSHAVAGSKRASNGALLAQQMRSQEYGSGSNNLAVGAPSTALPRAVSGKVDLAGAAARGAMAAENSASKWR